MRAYIARASLVVAAAALLIGGCDSDGDGGATSDVGSYDTAPPQDVVETPDTTFEDTATTDASSDAGVDTGADASTSDTSDTGDTGDTVAVEPRCIEGDFEPFFGLIHSHSTLSDGSGPPEEAFVHARDEAGLDIMLLSDHMEVFVGNEQNLAWCRETADELYVPGAYVTACDYEFATSLFGGTGHNNIFFAESLFPLEARFAAFYENLAACDGCVAQFNHPGDGPFQNWEDFAYDAVADTKLNLIEFNTEEPWTYFFLALDAGWHVSPTYNQDNHNANWGTKNDRRTGFWLSDLTRESVHTAMQDRRSFMSFDRNATIKMMADETCWMGSILTDVDEVSLTIEAADADESEGYSVVEIFGPAAGLVESFDCAGANPCVVTTTLPVTEPSFFVARATQDDGDYLVAAPIWVTP